MTLREIHPPIEDMLGPAEEIEVASWRLDGRLVGKLVFRTRGGRTGWFVRFGRRLERVPIEDSMLDDVLEAPKQPTLPAPGSGDPDHQAAAAVAELEQWRSARWAHWRDLELTMMLTRPQAAGWAIRRVRERLKDQAAKRASA